jgi:hypothetical protein
MHQLRSKKQKSDSRPYSVPVSFKIAGLVLMVSACSTVQPPRLFINGALPMRDEPRYVLGENPQSEALLPSDAVRHCLQSKGMLTGTAPQYFAQYAVAIRPRSSVLRIGSLVDAPASKDRQYRRKSGDRIIYRLIVDRLSDGMRIYDLSFDAAFKSRQSTAQSRVKQFCDVVGGNSGDQKAG